MERACTVVTLRKETIERIFRKHFKNNGVLQSISTLSLGAVNTSYKVTYNGRIYVLRLHTRDPEGAEKERSLYQLVQKKVAMPKLFYVGTDSDTPAYSIFEYIDKKHIFEIRAKKDAAPLCYALGKALAAIHSFEFANAGLFGKDFAIYMPFAEKSSPYYEYIIEHFSKTSLSYKRLGEAKAAELKYFLSTHRKYFPVINNGGVLVHSVFKPVNLLWDRRGGLTILDWEFAHIGHPLIDFGILLRHFEQFPFDLASLESGYLENGGILPDDWVQKARISDIINIIQLLNIEAERPKLFQFLKQSLDVTLAGPSALNALMKKENC